MIRSYFTTDFCYAFMLVSGAKDSDLAYNITHDVRFRVWFWPASIKSGDCWLYERYAESKTTLHLVSLKDENQGVLNSFSLAHICLPSRSVSSHVDILKLILSIADSRPSICIYLSNMIVHLTKKMIVLKTQIIKW